MLQGRYTRDKTICERTVKELEDRINQIQNNILDYNNAIREVFFRLIEPEGHERMFQQ